MSDQREKESDENFWLIFMFFLCCAVILTVDAVYEKSNQQHQVVKQHAPTD